MPIVTVTKILESVKDSAGLTRTLGTLQLWRREDKSIFYHVGNSIVLFKVRYNGEWRAMRCYTRRMDNLAELYGERYLPEELYIFVGADSGVWIDVVMEEWVDGITLREAIEEAVSRGDKARLKLLADRFDLLAKDLLSSDWAHGDLTAENILVTPTLRLRLIDFDGKYLPTFHGRCSPCLGTATFQPPSRRLIDFDRDIDDYSIALISTSLRALSLDEGLYHRYGFYDGILFDPLLIGIGRCEALSESLALLLSHNMTFAYRVTTLLRRGNLRLPPLVGIFSALPLGQKCDEPLSLTMEHGYVGYSDSNNRVYIPHIYDEGLEFRGGTTLVRMLSKWMVINKLGEVLASCEGCDKIKRLRGGDVVALRKGVWEEIYNK